MSGVTVDVTHRPVGVLGATSIVGRHLLPLLAATGRRVIACSRSAAPATHDTEAVTWRRPGGREPGDEPVADWIALCPAWAVPEHLDWLATLGASRIVVVSSQSARTKRASPHAAEREIAARLAAAEVTVRDWAAARGTTSCILRPTMIYDGAADANVAAIAAFVARRGWFPICGRATGTRQPVHAGDVAAACAAALAHPAPAAEYDLSGGETLSFRDMVARIAAARKLPVRIVHVPRPLWVVGEWTARRAGLARNLPPGAAARMNEDLSCGHESAARDLGFQPRRFAP